MEDIRALLWNRFYGVHPKPYRDYYKVDGKDLIPHMIIHMMNLSQFTGRSRTLMSQSILWISSMLDLTS